MGKIVPFLIALLIFASCGSCGSHVSCSESEALSFAKRSVETVMDEIGAYRTVAGSDDNCVYEFIFEGISHNYPGAYDIDITVKKTKKGWTVVNTNVQKL